MSTTGSPLAALAALAKDRDRLTGSMDETALRLVTQARRGGQSWEDIGLALGLTRQGAHARYAHRLAESEDVPAP